jgi:hypothetical protein
MPTRRLQIDTSPKGEKHTFDLATELAEEIQYLVDSLPEYEDEPFAAMGACTMVLAGFLRGFSDPKVRADHQRQTIGNLRRLVSDVGADSMDTART